MDNGGKEHAFIWHVENYSCCWHKSREELVSPKFTVDELEGMTWELMLYPRGNIYYQSGYMSLYLRRSLKCDGPEDFYVHYELSVIAMDGLATSSEKLSCAFRKGYNSGEVMFLKMDEILFRRRSHYLPQDTLTVCCKIWKNGGSVHHCGQSSARSRIPIEKKSFRFVLENFSTLDDPNRTQTLNMRLHSGRACLISSNLYFTEDLCKDEKIMIDIVIPNNDRILWKCEVSLLDASGNIVECGETDNRYEAAEKRVHAVHLSLKRSEILIRKSEYLPGDKLTLICECIFSSKLELETVEETLNELPLNAMKRKRNYIHRKNDYKAAKKLHSNPSVSEDMKSLYIDRYLTDVEVKTNTKSFPAHKIVLCARSRVFKAMLTKDMKEKNDNCIHVDDLEDDIVQQMLVFLYSDNIEDLQWENASQLYYAADKYQIGKLMEVCSCFFYRKSHHNQCYQSSSSSR